MPPQDASTSDDGVNIMATFDGRIVQKKPSWAAQKGALSITNTPFSAIASSSSQHTYNVQVSSENIFVARDINWTATVYLSMTWTLGAAMTVAPGTVLTVTAQTVSLKILCPGVSWSYRAFPLNALCSTLQCTINDTSVVINSNDVLVPLLHLVDFAQNRDQRTTPTRLDICACIPDNISIFNNPYGNFQDFIQADDIPNGAYAFGGLGSVSSTVTGQGVSSPYTDSFGKAAAVPGPGPLASTYYTITGYTAGTAGSGLTGQTTAGAAGSAAPAVTLNTDSSLTLAWTSATNGTAGTGGTLVPATATGFAIGGTITLYIVPTFTEKIVLPPFIFSDIHEQDVGLSGIQNMQFQMNLRSPQSARLLRQLQTSMTNAGTSVVNGAAVTGWNTSLVTPLTLSVATNAGAQYAFGNAHLDILMLTPSLDLPLPPKSVVPYLEAPRYISSGFSSINPNTVGTQLSSQSIVLPQIPDLLLIWAQPQSYELPPVGTGYNPGQGCHLGALAQADWFLPVQAINLNWDNFAGLLSSTTQAQLYAMSKANGLDMPYQQWVGQTFLGVPAYSTAPALQNTATTGPVPVNAMVQLTGGPLVLKPGKDFALQAGQAPSLVGNYTFQVTLTVNNFSSQSITPMLYICTLNTGFFESQKGTSRVVKGILSEASILGAAVASTATHTDVQRAVGGSFSGLFKGVSGLVSKLGPHVGKAVQVAKGAHDLYKGIQGGGQGGPAGGARTGGAAYKRKWRE